MTGKATISFCILLLLSLYLSAQDMAVDTVRLDEILVLDKRRFVLEDAGQKFTRVDSMAMIEKISASVSELLSENTLVVIKDHGRGALATASFRGTGCESYPSVLEWMEY
jgi:iron complex outermembrane receptor protein